MNAIQDMADLELKQDLDGWVLCVSNLTQVLLHKWQMCSASQTSLSFQIGQA